MGWPPNRESQWICDPINLGRGVVPIVFWGNQDSHGAGVDRCPVEDSFPEALNLMGELWCLGAYGIRHRLIENRGAFIRISTFPARVEKEGIRKILSRNVSCLLTLAR